MNLKNVVAVSLIIFGIFFLIFVVGGGFMILSESKHLPSPSVTRISSSPTASVGVGKAAVLTESEIGRHANMESCWLLISGKVYDVTTFIPDHPGGADRILANCGKDATTAYETQGGEGQHSVTSHEMLNQYYIGDFGQAVVPKTGK